MRLATKNQNLYVIQFGDFGVKEKQFTGELYYDKFSEYPIWLYQAYMTGNLMRRLDNMYSDNISYETTNESWILRQGYGRGMRALQQGDYIGWYGSKFDPEKMVVFDFEELNMLISPKSIAKTSLAVNSPFARTPEFLASEFMRKKYNDTTISYEEAVVHIGKSLEETGNYKRVEAPDKEMLGFEDLRTGVLHIFEDKKENNDE